MTNLEFSTPPPNNKILEFSKLEGLFLERTNPRILNLERPFLELPIQERPNR
jgi:hypothetical protein